VAQLTAGSRIGRYEILVELGAGGMGVVYRARDSRLGREVAVKVLAGNLLRSVEAVQRFELEARAASALDHPNVLTIYDVGTHEGAPYLVSELLSGATLRDDLRERLPPDQALDYAVQIAAGLAAAHGKGIVHRDLKPENLFVTAEGRVKIIDFGVAKLLENPRVLPPRHGGSPDPAPLRTLSGTVLGTVGYMAPEQIRGKPADHRADIFAFGAILYEMIAGERAFSGSSPFQTAYAILSSQPAPLPAGTSKELKEIVRCCLEKDPEDRFGSARDLHERLKRLGAGKQEPERESRSLVGAAFATLRGARRAPPAPRERLGGGLGSGGSFGAARVFRHPAFRAAAFLLVAAAAAAITFALLRARSGAPVSFQQLTFRIGTAWTARFAPDGETVLYSAAWDGKPVATYTLLPGKPEARSLDLPPARVLAVSRGGELALALEKDGDLLDYMRAGTLARASLAGGAPRELLTRVYTADFAPDGSAMAVVRDVDGMSRVEFPQGNPLYESSGWISHVRVSPSGQVAFIDHPFFGDTRGVVMLAAKGQPARPLTPDLGSAMGLAWSPRGDEVWFTAGDTLQSTALRAVSLGGAQRVLVRSAGSLALQDVARDGRVLLAQEKWRHFIRGHGPGEAQERDLTHLDYSVARELSADGRKLLFFEAGQGGGEMFGAYVRGTDGSAPVQVGTGYALSITADGNWAILASTKDPSQLLVVPTGAGESRTIQLPIAVIAEARWFPDGKRVLLTGRERFGGPLRVFVLDAPTGKLRPLTEAGVAGQEAISKPVSPDGKRVIVHKRNGFFIHPVEGGEATPVPGLTEGEVPIGWSADGGSLLVRHPGLPTRVGRLDLQRGTRTPWREFMPPEAAGVSGIPWIHFAFTGEGEAYAYSHHQIVSELYLVRGVE